MTFWKKLTHLIPSVRRASERDMQEEVESLREIGGPGALGNLTLAVEDGSGDYIGLDRLQPFETVLMDTNGSTGWWELYRGRASSISCLPFG